MDEGGGPPSAALLPDEQIGKRIGHYKLRERLGEGGMGVVYVAEQQEPVRRLVALKIIKPGMDSAQVLARFEAERQALALMDHPNIARVLDAGTTSGETGGIGPGRPYFVMELVKGVPITQYCDERRLSLRQRLELFIPVCQAVQHAHQKAIIHRDLKPSNILVALYDGKPVPKVIDFGVAKAMGEQLTEKSIYTGFGAVVGTLAYMSPEQAELNQLDIDTRSDIYSLGVVLYELLTGNTPLGRDRLKSAAILEVLRLIREEEPAPPSKCVSTAGTLVTLSEQRQTEPARLASLIRGDIDWIVMRALDKDRGRRYETANSLAADIERFLKDEPVEAGPPSPAYKLRKFVRRNRGAVLAASLILLALFAGTVGTTAGLFEARHQRDTADSARARAEKAEKEIGEQLDEVLRTKGQLATALTRAEKSAHEEKEARQLIDIERKRTEKELGRAESLLYVSLFKEAFHHYEKNDFVNCRVALDACRWDLRGPEYGYLVKQMDRRGQLLTGKRANGQMLLSRDGKRLFTGDTNSISVTEWDAETGKFVRTLRAPSFQCRSLAESSDGKLLFAGFGSMIIAWDLGTGETAFTLGQGNETFGFTSLAVSRDGKRLYAGTSRSNKGIVVWDLDERKEVFAFPSGTAECLVPSVDDKLLFAAEYHVIRVWDLATGKEAFKLDRPRVAGANAYSLALADRGQTLVANQGDEIVEWNAATGKEIRRWAAEAKRAPGVGYGESMAAGLALSKDRTLLATAKFDGTIMIWNVAKGTLQQFMRGHDYRLSGLAFSPDGRFLYSASGDGSLRMWDLHAKHESDVYTGHKTTVDSLVQDARGQRLVSADGDGAILVWDRATGKVVKTLAEKTYVNNLALSRDGKRLYTAIYDAKEIQAWDVDAGKKTFTLTGHLGMIRGLAVSPDGKTLYSGSDDKTIKAWDLETRKEIYTFREHVSQIQKIVLSNDGQRLVSSSNAGVIISADTKKWANYRSYQATPAIGHLALTGDGKKVVYGGTFFTIHVLDLDSGRELHVLRGHVPSGGIVISKDDRRIISAGQDGSVRFWDMISGRELLSTGKSPLFATSILLAANGNSLICGRGNGAIETWDLKPVFEGLSIRGPAQTSFTALAVSPDDKRLFSASFDKAVRAWDLESGKETLVMHGHTEAALALVAAPEGKLLISAGRDKKIRFWDLVTAKEGKKIARDKEISALALSHDGTRLFFADTTISEMDLTTGQVLRTLPGHTEGYVGSLRLSRDGTRLVSGAGDNTVKVWDLRAGKETLSLRGERVPVMSADGKRMVTWNGERSLKVWDLDAGKVVQTYSHPGGTFINLAMNDDGSRLYASDDHGVITVWDLQAGKAIRTLAGHTGSILRLTLSADGKRLYSSSHDGTIRVWNLETGK